MPNLLGFLFFVVAVVLPSYYFNKWVLKLTKPRQSFSRFVLYLIIIAGFALLFSTAAILIILLIYPLQEK